MPKKENTIYVVKASGRREPFSFRKVFISAKRAGAKRDVAHSVAEKIQKEVYNGMTTQEVYNLVKGHLGRESLKASIRFSLKEAMRKLGPTGFNFEKYTADILERNGYTVTLNERVGGKCIPDYEIDFIARKKNNVYIGECKYRWSSGDKIDLKVALYSYARYLDIMEGDYFKSSEWKGMNVYPMVVTNTAFTSLVIKYAKCYDMQLLGWGYPKEMSMARVIEDQMLHPVTILPSYNKQYDEIFNKNNIIMVKEVAEVGEEGLKKIGVKPEIASKLYYEAVELLKE